MYRLKDLNKQIAVDFDRLADTMTKTNIVYGKIAASYLKLGERNLNLLYNSLGEMHAKLGAAYKKSKEAITDDFLHFMRFYRHELISIEEILHSHRIAKEQLSSAEKKLWKKKESLFEQKQILKWEIDPSCVTKVDELLKSKALAFQEILPKETKDTAKLRIVYGFLSNRAMEEFHRISANDYLDINSRLLEASIKYTEYSKEIAKDWMDLHGRLKELYDHAYPKAVAEPPKEQETEKQKEEEES